MHSAIDFIASDLTPGLRAAARSSFGSSCCTLITIQAGLVEREVVQFSAACSSPGLRKKLGELVRVDFNVTDGSAAAEVLRRRLRLLIGPYIEGVGKVRIDDSPEGIVILGLDIGEGEDSPWSSQATRPDELR